MAKAESTVIGLGAEPRTKGSVRIWLGRLLRLLLVAVILAASGAVSYYWMAHPPKTQRRPPGIEPRLVEVTPVHRETGGVVIKAMGTVVPAKKIQIASHVGGQITSVSPQFVPGGHFSENDQIAQVEQSDYELAVRQRQGDLVKAQSDVKLEMGQQSVARREYELLGEGATEKDEELLLRQPQLASRTAAVSVAEAALDKAKLDLKRTDITAPFNAVVESRNVDLGAYVAPGTPLATLVGTDEYWVEVSVPVDQLKWIRIPGLNAEEGASAKIYNEQAWGTGAYREGTVQRLMAELEPEGQMARLLVVVKDPLQLNGEDGGAKPLLLGSFLRVEIEGKGITNVVKTPRVAVRDGNQVWVMSSDRTLDIRDIQTVWSGVDNVYVTEGLNNGDLLVTSDLAAPVKGMPLTTGDAPTSATRQASLESENGEAPESAS